MIYTEQLYSPVYSINRCETRTLRSFCVSRKEWPSLTKAISLWLKKKAKRRQTQAMTIVAAIKTGTFCPEIVWHIDKGLKNLVHVLLQFVSICYICDGQQAWEGTNEASSSSRIKGTSAATASKFSTSQKADWANHHSSHNAKSSPTPHWTLKKVAAQTNTHSKTRIESAK